MVENSSGKEKKSKLTSLKIHCAKNFQPTDSGFIHTSTKFPNDLKNGTKPSIINQ